MRLLCGGKNGRDYGVKEWNSRSGGWWKACIDGMKLVHYMNQLQRINAPLWHYAIKPLVVTVS